MKILKKYSIMLYVLFIFFNLSCQQYPRTYLTNYQYNDSIKPKIYFDSINFWFGAATNHVETMNKQLYLNTFNSMTVEWELQWGALAKNGKIGEYDFSKADSIVDHAIEKGFRVVGHSLLWGSLLSRIKKPDMEKHLKQYKKHERELILDSLIHNHITTVLNRYKGRIYHWHVVNEPLNTYGGNKYDNTILNKYFGDSYIEKTFRLAHSIDSSLILYLNEQIYDYNGPKATQLLYLLRKLKNENVPVHRLGLQGHIIFEVPKISDFKRFTDSLSSMNIDFEITEFDARLRLFREEKDPYQAQSDYYREFIKVCIENKNCKGITFWGYTDADCWQDRHMAWLFRKPNNNYIFDENMQPKPIFYMLTKDKLK